MVNVVCSEIVFVFNLNIVANENKIDIDLYLKNVETISIETLGVGFLNKREGNTFSESKQIGKRPKCSNILKCFQHNLPSID